MSKIRGAILTTAVGLAGCSLTPHHYGEDDIRTPYGHQEVLRQMITYEQDQRTEYDLDLLGDDLPVSGSASYDTYLEVVIAGDYLIGRGEMTVDFEDGAVDGRIEDIVAQSGAAGPVFAAGDVVLSGGTLDRDATERPLTIDVTGDLSTLQVEYQIAGQIAAGITDLSEFDGQLAPDSIWGSDTKDSVYTRNGEEVSGWMHLEASDY